MGAFPLRPGILTEYGEALTTCEADRGAAYDILAAYVKELEKIVQENDETPVVTGMLYDSRIHKPRFTDELTSTQCNELIERYTLKEDAEGKGDWMERIHKDYGLKVGQVQAIIKEYEKDL